MNKSIKAKWVEALESGQYKQGKWLLRNFEDRFCCLGVLLDVVDKRGWGKSPENCSYFTHRSGSCWEGLSKSFEKKCGLSNEECGILIVMNDSGKKFKTIAKYIQENL